MQSLELKNNPFCLLPDLPCKRLCLPRSSSVLLLAWGSPSPPPRNGFINSFINYLQGLEVPDLPSSATQCSPRALLWVRVPVVQWDVQGAPCLQRGAGHNLKAKNLQEMMEHSPRRLGVGSSHILRAGDIKGCPIYPYHPHAALLGSRSRQATGITAL